MCGIVGVAGLIEFAHEKAFKDLLVIDSLRGIDSVGVAAIDLNGETTVFKKAMYAQDFLQLKGITKIFQKNNQILIGHNRAATQGRINNTCAHPFEFDSVVGVHNGTLKRQSLLPDSQNFAVDSENIFHSINVDGVEKTYKNISGAAALVYYNKDMGSLHFLRNKERPFFFTYTENRKTIFWASEAWMLSGILARHGIKHTEIVATQVDFLYTFRMDETKKKDPLCKLVIRQLKPYNEPVSYMHNYHNRGVRGQGALPSTEIRKKYPVGSRVDFSCSSAPIPRYCSFIDGTVTSDSKVPVRIFIHTASVEMNKCLEKGDDYNFTARVNGFDGMGNLLVQVNSVTAVKKTKKALSVVEKKEEVVLVDWSGEMISEAQFKAMRAPAKDCCWCSSPIQFVPGNAIINDTTTICDMCVEDEEVKAAVGRMYL